MADKRQVINIILNTEKHSQVDVQNFDIRTKLILFRGTHVLINADLKKDGAATTFNPDPASTWNFRVDTDFDSSPDLIVSENDQFNIVGDRTDLDIAGGKISFRVDTNTTQLETELTGFESKDGFAELWMVPPGENPVLVAHWGITLANISTEFGDSVDLVFTNSNVVAFDGDDVVIFFPDGSVAQRLSP